jgi:hypothetical protein
MYLPEHVSVIMRRLWFYWGGDETATVKSGLTETMGNFGSGAGDPGDVIDRLGSL